MQQSEKCIQTRDVSIDRFRGFIVFCMLFFIAAGDFPCLGLLSRFANSSATGPIMLFKGMSLADLVAPIFLFLIGISYQGSFDRRYAENGNKAYIHFLMRYLCFIGVGSIIVSAEYIFITDRKDPYFIQTILMFVVLVGAVLLAILKCFKSIHGKYIILLKNVLLGSLLILGALGIILGIRDDVIIFFNLDAELYKHWSILHEIGMTGLLVIPFLKMDVKGKIKCWCVIAAIYTAIQMIPGVIEQFDIVVLGGFVGTLGWLILMLGSIIFIQLYREEHDKKYYISMSTLLVCSVLTCALLPMNTSAVTIGYVLFALLCACTMFILVNLFKNWNPKVKFFVWWGENPLLIFLIGLLFRGAQKIWNPPVDTPLWIAILFVFGESIFLTCIAYYLYKKKIHFRF